VKEPWTRILLEWARPSALAITIIGTIVISQQLLAAEIDGLMLGTGFVLAFFGGLVFLAASLLIPDLRGRWLEVQRKTVRGERGASAEYYRHLLGRQEPGPFALPRSVTARLLMGHFGVLAVLAIAVVVRLLTGST
jgi:hypothetical protein